MKRLYPSIFLAAIVISAIAATVKISDLPISTSPSTNTFIEIADMNAVTKSSKYLLTNLVTVAQGQASTNALTNTFVLKAGDTMTGDLTTTGIIVTNDAISDVPFRVNMLTASTNAAIDVSVNGSRNFALYPGGANIMEQRNGTNAQAFRIYNTYANSGTDYERGELSWSGNFLSLKTANGGTGVARAIIVDSASDLYFRSGGTTKWLITTAGHLMANSDNTYDIGASGATRPRDGFFARNLRAEGTLVSAGLTLLNGGGARGTLQAQSSDGVITIANAGGTDFSRLQFGGTTTNYPALTTRTNVAGMPYLAVTDATGASLRKIVNAGVNGGRTNVLTDATATSVLYISVPNTNRVSGKLFYEIFATDGTESQGISGECKFVAISKGTAVTAQIADVQTTAAVSAGTLAATIAYNVATNNVFAITINSDTSLTTTNHTAVWRIESPNTFDVNPL